MPFFYQTVQSLFFCIFGRLPKSKTQNWRGETDKLSKNSESSSLFVFLTFSSVFSFLRLLSSFFACFDTVCTARGKRPTVSASRATGWKYSRRKMFRDSAAFAFVHSWSRFYRRSFIGLPFSKPKPHRGNILRDPRVFKSVPPTRAAAHHFCTTAFSTEKRQKGKSVKPITLLESTPKNRTDNAIR